MDTYVHVYTRATVCHIQQGCVSVAVKAEQAVKEAAEAINKHLPKEAQGGSMQPLVEEKEEGEGQALDTFSAEIDALDQVRCKRWCELHYRVWVSTHSGLRVHTKPKP